MEYPKPRAEEHFRTLRKTEKQVNLIEMRRASKHRREFCRLEHSVSHRNTLRVDANGAQ